MKTTKMNIGLVAAFLVAAMSLSTAEIANAQTVSDLMAVNEQPTQRLNVKLDEVKKLQFRLAIENPTGRKTYIRILDNQKEVLFATTQRETSYVKFFNLANLADGAYTFEVVNGDDTFKKSFEILTQTSRVILAKN
jgi:hypothetical protein